MDNKIYINCDLGALKKLEGSFITQVEYDDNAEMVTITGVKKAKEGTREVGFQLYNGECYGLAGKE